MGKGNRKEVKCMEEGEEDGVYQKGKGREGDRKRNGRT